ncbi:uncharacterized protein [Porites lutea]|uniref:uncharacterized protein n=1 Tax=Porites lutea TaxID=51062 RepID=UPI003CC5F23F
MACAQYDGMYVLPKKAIILVICLLNVVIESHMRELRQRSISCTCHDAEQDGAYNGDYSIIFVNPEALILKEKWRTMIQTPVYQTNLFGIVADEAHVIPKCLYLYRHGFRHEKPLP